MFYLTKFCRICIRSNGPLIDVDSEDADAVKLSDKLRYIRAKMVIGEEAHRRLMCYECVQKLRVSYLFQKQCTKADQILERYLQEITTVKDEPVEDARMEADDATPNRPRNKVVLATNGSKPVRFRRRLKQEASFRISEAYKDRIRRLRRFCPRITKQQRCMLLKTLLAKSDHNSNSPAPFRKSRKYALYHSRQAKPARRAPGKRADASKGGLRDLLGFIRCYDFGFDVDESDIKEQCDGTVLDRLESFSRTFFYSDFQAYRDTILSLANDSESSDDDDMFEPFDEAEDRSLWPECLDATIKQELDANDAQNANEPRAPEVKVAIKRETPSSDNDEDNADLPPSALVQACYEDQPSPRRIRAKINRGFQHFMNTMKTNLAGGGGAAELSDPATIVNHINRISVIPEASSSASMSSLDLLARLTNSTRLAKDAPRKAPPPPPARCHLKCRTRGNPFISPQLMQQFQTRTFRCDTCNRSFKSPGYLHSHCTKMGH